MAPTEQQRQSPRFDITAYIDVTSDQFGGMLLFNRIENISVGGMAFSVPQVVPNGTIVHVTITFPDTEETIETDSEVMWANIGEPSVIGVKFNDLHGDAKDIIERYLHRIALRQQRLQQ